MGFSMKKTIHFGIPPFKETSTYSLVKSPTIDGFLKNIPLKWIICSSKSEIGFRANKFNANLEAWKWILGRQKAMQSSKLETEVWAGKMVPPWFRKLPYLVIWMYLDVMDVFPQTFHRFSPSSIFDGHFMGPLCGLGTPWPPVSRPGPCACVAGGRPAGRRPSFRPGRAGQHGRIIPGKLDIVLFIIIVSIIVIIIIIIIIIITV